MENNGWVKKPYKPWNISVDGSEIRLTTWDGDKTLQKEKTTNLNWCRISAINSMCS